MKITALAYSEEIEPDENPEEVEVTEEVTEKTPETSLDNIGMYYLDPSTGSKSMMNTPSSIQANDGSQMLTGVIRIEGITDIDEVDDLVEKGLLDRVVQFINLDPRLNLTINSLITDRLYQGLISFIVSVGLQAAASSRKIIVADSEAKEVMQANVDKVCKDFLNRFSIGKDISDFNINKANSELYELIEKVAVHLTPIEKKKVRTNIRRKLAEHNIQLIYLENNC